MGSAGRSGLSHRVSVTRNGGDGSHGMLGMPDADILFI